MFTGIIESLGTVRRIHSVGTGKRMTVECGFDLSEIRLGDSIAVNGACLTAVQFYDNGFAVDMSPETVEKTTLGRMQAGDRVNLERALRLSDRLDGHLVSGHVDGIGSIREKARRDNAIIVRVTVPPPLKRYLIQKGSVAVDGISLTINALDPEGFTVSVIPHTAEMTTIGFKQTGDAVNIETDLIGKYVERFMTADTSTDSDRDAGGVDLDLLRTSGFL